MRRCDLRLYKSIHNIYTGKREPAKLLHSVENWFAKQVIEFLLHTLGSLYNYSLFCSLYAAA